MRQAMERYPCDILFVHRDAEGEPRENRVREVAVAANEAQLQCQVAVVPVRMTEAWILLDVDAIRRAADNPNGRATIRLPDVADLETIPDPKNLLNELLMTASEKRGRRRDQFHGQLSWRRQRVASLIRDFAPLRKLSAFNAFAAETQRVVSMWVGAAGGG